MSSVYENYPDGVSEIDLDWHIPQFGEYDDYPDYDEEYDKYVEGWYER